SFVDRFTMELVLARPSAGRIRKVIAVAWRQIPHRGLGAFERERALCPVANDGVATQNAVLGVDAIVQRDFDGVGDVAEGDLELVAVDAMRGVTEDEITITVVARQLESGFEIARSAPARELLRLEHLARVKAGEVAARCRSGEVIGTPE